MSQTLLPETRELIVPLVISPDELLKLYRGEAREVVARSVDGQSVRFPADALKPFVSRYGVHGRYKLTISRENRLLSIELLN